MAHDTVLAAVMAVLDGLDGTKFPGGDVFDVYFDEAPLTAADGSRVFPPYLVIKDYAETPEFDFDSDAVEEATFTLDIVADTLADCGRAYRAVRWNGAPPRDRAGLDNATLDLTAPLSGEQVANKGGRWSLAGIGRTGQRTHMISVSYKASSQVVAAQAPA